MTIRPSKRRAERPVLSRWSRVPLSAKLVLFSALLVVAAVAVGIGTTLQVSATLADDAREREVNSHVEAFQARLEAEQNRAESLVTTVAAMPEVQEAMAAGDRERLLAMFTPGFDELSDVYGVEQFQFHLPPATSFARVHKPEKFGDDLSSFRHTVVAANTDRQLVAGVESGVAGIGMRAVSPVTHEGRHVGTVEFGLSIGQSFLDGFAEDFGVDAALWVLDESSELTAVGSTTEVALADLSTVEGVFASGESSRDGRDLDGRAAEVALEPVLDYAGEVAAVVPLAVDVQALESARGDARSTGLLIGGIVLAVGLILAWLVSRAVARSITTPVARMGEVLGEVADGDLTRRAPVEGPLEVQQMAQALNRTLDSTADVLRSIGRSSGSLSGSSGELSAASQSLLDVAGEASTETATGASEQVSDTLQTVASAAEEIGAAIREISSSASEAADVASQAVSLAAETNGSMSKLADSSAQIGEVVAVITAIAEQTNLLALNATIESARAGEAGKGFAVVANEVKELAKQTSSATEQIAGNVLGIQSDAVAAVEAIDRIGSVVQRINELQATIAAAVEEQNVTTAEITLAVTEAAGSAGDISNRIARVSATAGQASDGAGTMHEAAAGLSSLAGELDELVRRFRLEKAGV